MLDQDNNTKMLLDHFPLIIIEIDIEGNIIYCNKRAVEQLGYYQEELLDSKIWNILSDEHSIKEKLFSLLQKDNHISFEGNCKKKDSSLLLSHIYTNAMYDPHDIYGFRFIILDITDVINVRNKLREVEHNHKVLVDHAIYSELHDPITNVFNKDVFASRLQVEAMRLTRKDKTVKMFAVMCIGIDKFKTINDMYSPRVGDMILEMVAKRIQHSLRREDMISRYEGDKFLLFFSDISSEGDIPHLTQKIFNVFDDAFIIEKKMIQLTVSIGVCIYPINDKDEELLINNAEEAMHVAKEIRRNSYAVYDEKVHVEILKRLKLEQHLSEAIVKNEFVPYFQPKVDSKGEIIGMESLIRWQPEMSNDSFLPASFIPLVEKNGMILEIGNNILYKSCMQVRKWIDKGLSPQRVAVNLSPLQFKQYNLIENIIEIINDTGIPVDMLEFEITETGIIKDEKESIEKLKRLSDLGVAITIDDFGTGYSSLSKLKDYPIDTLKIDKSFIENLPYDKKSKTIAITIIDLAHNLDFKVVSEGIENNEQYDLLKKYNCDYFQGFLFCEPLPPEKYEEGLKTVKEGGCFFDICNEKIS